MIESNGLLMLLDMVLLVFNRQVMSDSLRLRGLQHANLMLPSAI